MPKSKDMNDYTSAGGGLMRDVNKKETEKYIKAVEKDLRKQMGAKVSKEAAQLSRLHRPRKAGTR